MSQESETHDATFMARALLLAEATVGLASPNPQVGCVLVRDGLVLGEGAHLYDGFDHAEIVALKATAAAGLDTAGATAYVTLEPCSHQGRTGPCADALISAGIARCVVATVDPNPAVSGRGLRRLEAAGIGVTPGVLEAQARTLNDAFALSITQNRPFVTLKAALSVDGYLAPPPASRSGRPQPYWLTGPESRAEVQRLRHGSDAILTGIGTVLADDPLLTDRSGLPRRRALLRVVLDSELRIPLASKLVQTAAQNPQQDLWIFCGPAAPSANRVALEALGIRITEVPLREAERGAHLDLREVLAQLASGQIRSLLLEAGSQLNAAFLRDDLVDRAVLFYAETELGEGAVPFAADVCTPFALEERFLAVNKRTFGLDVCVSGVLHHPWRQR